MGLRSVAALAFLLALAGPSTCLKLGRGTGQSESLGDFWPVHKKAAPAHAATTKVNKQVPAKVNSKFILLSQPRSGARFVMEMLGSHPRMRGGHDEFRTCCAGGACDEGKMQQVLDKWFTDGGFWQEHPGIRARGFQAELSGAMFRKDGSPTAVADYLAKHNVKVVFLWRRNELRRHISIAAKTDQWREQGAQMGGNVSRIAHPVAEEDVKKVREFRPSLVTGAHLISKLRHGQAERVQAKALLKNIPRDLKYTVFYEDLLSATNPESDEAWQELQDFLGVPLVPERELRSKSTHLHMEKDLGELLKNAAEVRTSLVGTEFEPMLM